MLQTALQAAERGKKTTKTNWFPRYVLLDQYVCLYNERELIFIYFNVGSPTFEINEYQSPIIELYLYFMCGACSSTI